MHDLVNRLDARAEVRLVPYAFERAYGYAPASLWRAPYTVRLADSELVMALRWQVVAAVAPRSDGVLRLGSLNRPAEGVEISSDASVPVPDWARLAVDAVRNGGLSGQGLDVLVHADLPASSGLPADVPTACAVAVAAAGGDVARAFEAVGDEAGPVLYGRAGFAVRGKPGAASVELVPYDLEGLRAMLIVTRPESVEREGALSRELAIGHAMAGGARSAWPVGETAVAAIVPESGRAEVRTAVASAFRTEGLRAPRFLSLQGADGVRRLG